MFPIIYIIILTLLAIGLAIFLVAWKVARREKTSVVEEFVGICTSAFEQTAQKEANKKKILALLEERRKTSPSTELGINNKEIREHLGVASRTVVKYMSELEKEGRVEQVGETGRGVTYRFR